MRVLVVTTWFPSAEAVGSGIFNWRDVEMLATEHEVSVLHLHDPARPATPSSEVLPPGIKVERVPFSTSRPRSYAVARKAVAAALQQAELVHTMAFPALLPVWLGRGRANHDRASRRVPWVHTEHWSGLVNKQPSLLERVSRNGLGWLLRKPNVVVAVGDGLAKAVQKHRVDQVEVIGNRVTLAEDGTLASAPEVKDSPLRLIGVGGLVPWKGPIEAVETVAALRGQGTDSVLRWAGDGPLREAVQQRAAQLGVRDQVVLLGQCSPEDLSVELGAAHMFLLPTTGETFGVAIAEALGHGLPVVSSGVGGHRDFLPPEASRIVKDRTDVEFARAILDLRHDSTRWAPHEIANYARRTFSEELRRSRYASVYQRAISVASRR